MKRITSIILVLLLLSACAPGVRETTAPTTPPTTELAGPELLIGYGEADITPQISVPLRGYGRVQDRYSKNILDPLMVSCMAITDEEGNTILLMAIDLTTSATVTDYRVAISKETGVPVNNIAISASHTHSAPDMDNGNVAGVSTWTNTLIKLLVECADEAMEDRAPADMYVTSTQTDGLNFVRRYELEDGHVEGYESIIRDSGLAITGHESEADHTLQLLKFDRGEGKTPILVANYQTHPHRGGSANDTSMTADLVGAFRDEVTKKLGYDVVYFTGASGNVNPYSMIKEENITADYKTQGVALAQYAIDADSTYTAVNGGTVRGKQVDFTGTIDHTEDHLKDVAKEAQALWKETNDIMTVTNAFIDQGIHGPYHANAIVNKAGMNETESFTVYAVSFGDIGFAVAPYEMFDTNGMYIKDNSPFTMTFVATCANGSNGYIPSSLAWDNRGYEVDTCRFLKGTGEELATLYTEMLTELHTAK